MNKAVNIGPSLMDRQNISIKGAKGFRFSSQSNGSSSFGQSLDLAISGELTPGLELTGSISDRGISPTYGSANSRLNEFDRLNLTLRSNRFTAQLGDVVIAKNHGTSSNKSISGVAMALEYPNWQANSVVARPRGRYFTMSLKGRDGFQGPYRIVEGATAQDMKLILMRTRVSSPLPSKIHEIRKTELTIKAHRVNLKLIARLFQL